MSYETCDKHGEDATNGCAKCEAEQVDMLSSTAAVHMTRMEPEHLRQKLRKADSDFLERLVMYLITSLVLAGCGPSSEERQQMHQKAEFFEKYVGITRLGCRTNGFGLACSGWVDKRPVKYLCSPDSCGWVGGCQ